VTEAGRTRWTDERIDNLALGARDGMHDVRAETRQLRDELRDVRAELGAQIAALRSETNAGFRTLHAEVAVNRRWLVSSSVTMMLAVVGLLVEIGLR